MEITAIIVCLIHSNNLFVAKCFLDAVNVMKHFLMYIHLLCPFQPFIFLQKPHVARSPHPPLPEDSQKRPPLQMYRY